MPAIRLTASGFDNGRDRIAVARAVATLMSGNPRQVSGLFWLPDFAPALRADRAVNGSAGTRRLEDVAIGTALRALWIILIRDRFLRHFRRGDCVSGRPQKRDCARAAGRILQQRATRYFPDFGHGRHLSFGDKISTFVDDRQCMSVRDATQFPLIRIKPSAITLPISVQGRIIKASGSRLIGTKGVAGEASYTPVGRRWLARKAESAWLI
jgi:hypothetical protein